MSLALFPLMLTIGMIQWYFHYQFVSWEIVAVHITVAIVFMNLLHVGLTLSMLALTPQFREYLRTQTSWVMKKSGLITASLLIFGLVLLHLNREMTTTGWLAESTRWLPSFLILTPLDIWNSLHIRRQTMGLSMLYNMGLRETGNLTSDETTDLSRREKLERWAFTALTVTLFTRVISHVIWGRHAVEWGDYALATMELGICSFIFLQARKAPRAAQSNKSAYLWRVLFYPLAALHVFFSQVLQSIHGIEYFFLCRKMIGNTGLKESRKRDVLFFGLAIGSFAALPFIIRTIMAEVPAHTDKFTNVPAWAFLLLAAARSLNFIHFLIDGYIFRFRDPAVRENVRPLLSSMQPEEVAQERAA